MKKAFVYFGLQLKRAAKYFPFILALSLILCICLGAVLGAVVKLDSASEDKQKVTLGIVGDTEGSYLGFGISALQTLDSSRFVVEMVEMTEDEAKKKLENGEISAYAVIPEDFVDSAVSGEIKKIRYVTTDSAIGVTTVFMDEMLDAISVMLVESQKGVYGLQSAMWDKGYSAGNHMDKLASEYFSLILARAYISEQTELGISDELSFGGYMFCGILVFFVLLCGIPFCPVYIKKDVSLSRLMRASGRSVFSQVLGEYFSFFFFMFANLYIIVCALPLFAGDALSFIPELSGVDLVWAQKFAFSLIPAVLLISALQFLVYEISSGLVGGVLAQFLGAIALAYVCGCLYPINFFPDAIKNVSAFLPVGAAREYICALIGDGAQALSFIKIFAMFALLLSLAMIKRRQRILRF